jgi:hypothetical protein
MKNKILTSFVICLLSVACSKDKADDPLIIPPNFNIVPKDAKDESIKGSRDSEDIEELKDLLLE